MNGIEISVTWDSDSNDYTIYFPQIELGEEASEKGVYDQIIRISSKSEDAKKLFECATELAKKESDGYKIYEQVGVFARNLR